MTAYTQRKLDLEERVASTRRISPAGYKGLSGFHKYWGKKPTEAWRFLIENLTVKNDIVLDPFLGSGLIARECSGLERRFVGFDVNPISIELTRLYLELPDCLKLKRALIAIEDRLKKEINKMYALPDSNIITHFLWEKEKIIGAWTKHGCRRVEIPLQENEMEKFEKAPAHTPGNTRNVRLFDNSRINSKRSLSLEDLFTPRALCAIDLLKKEIDEFNGDVKRALTLILSASLGQMSKMVFAVSKRGKTRGEASDGIEVGSWVIGYWRPEKHFEINAWNCFANKANKLLKAIKEVPQQETARITENVEDLLNGRDSACIRMGDAEFLLKDVPSNSVEVVLTDPPHGDRIPYLELSEMWNSVIGLDVDYSGELIISNAKERGKNAAAYNKKLASILSECARVLMNDGLMAVMFNARSKEHWDGLRKLENLPGLAYIGGYPMEYSAASVTQDNRKGGLKTDFVLLYAKNASDRRKKKISATFKVINGWSPKRPQKAQSLN